VHVGGFLRQREFTDGEAVKAGDVMFRIDPRGYEAALARAKAQMAQAQATVTQAAENFTRVEGLAARAGNPRCKSLIVMGVTNPDADKHNRHSMVLVPMDTPGVQIVRALEAFGFDDAPSGHMELAFSGVRVPKANLIQTEGSGFALAQARLGPGRIHHCMRLIGLAQRALELMIERAKTRVAFGKPLAAQGMVQDMIALSRCEIEQARLLTMNAAAKLDVLGNKGAKDEIGMIKIVAPRMAYTVIDRAIQLYGAEGLQHPFLAHALVGARCLRLADGPDETHIAALARSMLK